MKNQFGKLFIEALKIHLTSTAEFSLIKKSGVNGVPCALNLGGTPYLEDHPS